MLAAWLAPDSVASFVDTHLRKSPYARPGAAAGAVPLLDWETVDRVLRAPPPRDLMVVAGGRLVDRPAPRGRDDVARLMSEGVSVVVRKAERHDEGLAALTSALTRDVPGRGHAQIYATPAGTNSFGWHFDFEDVFIVQTLGIKDYYFRDNTVARHYRLGQQPDFALVRQESTPIFTARLWPGDWLYIPARWWHLVKCVEDSLSISTGIFLAAEYGPG